MRAEAEVILERGGPVARSLRITGSTHMMAGAISAAVALNGMAASSELGSMGQVVVLVVLFISLAACSAAISIDILNRSSKVVGDLRSIGASRWSVSSALFGSLLLYGAVGSTFGALVGAGLGAALSGSGLGLGTAVEVFAVLVASVGALAAGSFAGERATWPS
jgi:hypothetical protein